jgi:dihydrofolate synthase/folylpolyglutamate synthase
VSEAQKKISAFLKFGSRLGLERMDYLMGALGRPDEALRVLHVAGTNGKGSVCRYLYESLLAAGHTAGLFISPYVLDFRERISADGAWISEADLERLTDEVIAAADGCLRDTGESPTEFEIITAIGLLYFASRGVDYAVLEVGLGGRGDATNIVKKPLVSIITSISRDHMEQLGDTTEKIAFEKAGIIKAGCPVVSGVTDRAAQKVIARRAYELGAPFFDASRVVRTVRVHETGPGGSRFSADIEGRHYDGIEIAMPGAHQIENAVTALCALEVLKERGGVREGMKRAVMPARCQVVPLGGGRIAIYDGAHNVAGARALAETLAQLGAGRGAAADGDGVSGAARILFVVSILRDKEAAEMLRVFAEAAGPSGAFIATQSANERCIPAAELADMIDAAGGRVVAVCPDAAEAAKRASDGDGLAPTEYDMIVYAGSLYLMGEVLV